MSTAAFEIWADVPAFEGHYKVSAQGRVRSLDRFVPVRGQTDHLIRGKILSAKTDPDHYKSLTLRRPGFRRSVAIHVLVLEVFRGPCPLGHESRHLNGRKWDNSLPNLVWATHQENERDKIRHRTQLRGNRHPNSKLTDDQVIELRSLAKAAGKSPTGRMRRHTGPRLAALFGISLKYAQSLVERADRKNPHPGL